MILLAINMYPQLIMVTHVNIENTRILHSNINGMFDLPLWLVSWLM